jgi:hypothetical protein
MIDIARAKLPGGQIGDYQIGRGMSALVLANLGVSAPEFVELVGKADNEQELADRLCSPDKRAERRALSARLRRLTVRDVPDDLRPEFESFYGADLPGDRLIFDVLEANDIDAFAMRTEDTAEKAKCSAKNSAPSGNRSVAGADHCSNAS